MRKPTPPHESIRAGWLKPLTPGAGPRYQQIVGQLAQAIRTGELASGDQIPPQRWLASELGIDLTTVTRAYTEARNRGLIASFSGRGSYVLAGGGSPHPGSGVDLSMNIPPQPAGGELADRVRNGVADILDRQGIEALSVYQNDATNVSAMQAGQAWLGPALGALASRPLLVCAGTQAAIFSVLLTVARAGDTVLCEPLTYPGFLLAASQLDLRVQAVESDADGVLPDAIDRQHRNTGARVVYLNPTLHNPTTRTMPEQRRRDVAAVLQKRGLTLIEDDPYRYLLHDAPPPLATFTGGQATYYLASLSNCLWPSLRVSFIVPPAEDSGAGVQDSLRASSMGCSSLLLALGEQWIRSGAARQIVQDIQREARARQALARALLPGTAQAPPTGLHVWLPLPGNWNTQVFANALEQRGIIVAGSDAFSVQTSTGDAVRLSIGGARNQEELGQALRQIAALLNEDHRRPSRAIV